MYRCYLDGTGLYIPRKFRRPEDAVLVLTGTKTQMETVEPYVSENLRPNFGVLCNQVDVQLETVTQVSRFKVETSEVEVLLPIPEKLKRFCEDHNMHSINEVNWVIDGQVSDLSKLLKVLINLEPTKAESVEVLQKYWFKEDGPKILSFSNPEQWLAINELYTNLPENVEAAVDQAGVRVPFETIQLLNSHHGNLQGITETTEPAEKKPTIKEQRAEAMDSFHKLLGNVITFANVAWPDDETSNYRKALLAPYLERVQRKNKLATNKKKRKAKQEMDIEEKNNKPDPVPYHKHLSPEEGSV